MSRGHRTRNHYNSDVNDSDFERMDNEEEEEVSEEYEEDLHQQADENEQEREQEEDEEDEDEDQVRGHRKRTRNVINYNEDKLLPSLDEDEYDENHNNNDGDDDDDINAEFNTKRRKQKQDDDEFDPVGNKMEDEYEDDANFSDIEEDEDEYVKPRRPRGFIVKDDDDDEDGDDDDEFKLHENNHRRQFRRGPRSSTRLAKLYSDDEHKPLTLEQELRDLAGDSPLNSPKRNLRDRKEVNYTLLPPDLSEVQLEELNTSPRRKGGRFGGSASSATSSQIRRLFPTQGPFGGSDVTSLFQQGLNSLTTIGNVESSDSEDENELIKPTNPNDMSNIITTSLNSNTKKKSTLADTDPLGIDTNIDFSVIGGLSNYIDQLKEMITLPLLYPEVYSKFHITPPRGVLFHGPPGTGKTLMARALAASCSSQNKKITFFMRKGADCLSKWVGEAERHLRLLFEEAKQHQPSIIFFDEIDGLAPVRSSKQEQIHASIVSTLLALMDGMDNRGQVIIIGATNRPDSIDPALRRPGRFDREFYFPLPDLKAREDILKIHMRKWDKQLDDGFIEQLARLTKGYGGADLRALCTESALNSIQRSYPEIYKSNDKLKIDINKIEVNASDFTRALSKVIPNSARSTSNINQPLPEHIKPLLNDQLQSILIKLKEIIPLEKPISLLEDSEYITTNKDFQSQQLINEIESMRVFKPRMGISGELGQGIKYISNAILNKLEGFTIQILDLSKLFSDSSVIIENLCIQMISELKRHKPSILFIPDLIGFLQTISESCKSTLRYLIRGIGTNDKILILCEIEGFLNDEILDELELLFNINEDSIILMRNSSLQERIKFFEGVWESIYKTPHEYNDISIRPKRKPRKLKKIVNTIVNNDNNGDDLMNSNLDSKKRKEIIKNDMRLKNSLKIKLSGLMDLFKSRYKRFKKPIIEDGLLIHLFDPIPDIESNYQIDHDMILEKDTGKRYFNIDLDVIEERLWNGYYSEPKQFLNDLNMILKDSQTNGDRDRILKANEMIAHASVGVEEIETQFPQLNEQWKTMRQREKVLQKKAEIAAKNQAQAQIQQETVIETIEQNGNVVIDVTASETVVTTPTPVPNGTIYNKTTTEGGIIIEENGEGKQVQIQVEEGTIVNDEAELVPKPVEIEEPLAKERVAEEVVAEQAKKEEEGEEEDEQEEDQEQEEEEEELAPQVVELNGLELDQLKKDLISKTENKKVSSLERIYGHLMKQVWDHRLELNKENLLKDIKSYIGTI